MLKGQAESQFIQMSGKGLGWPSAAALALPTANATTAQPIASWRTLAGFAGPASGGTLVKQVSEFTLTLQRKLKAITTMQGAQTPYWIQQAEFTVAGSLVIPVPADETYFNYMINNTQPQLQLVISNGLAGASLISLQVDIQNAAFKAVPIDKSETMGYKVNFDVPASVTNAGVSGGRSPIKITTSNNVHEAY